MINVCAARQTWLFYAKQRLPALSASVAGLTHSVTVDSKRKKGRHALGIDRAPDARGRVEEATAEEGDTAEPCQGGQ